MVKESYTQEYVKCGKKGCKSCPHGPYWYAYRKENGKTKKRYVGKERPIWEHPAEKPQNDARDVLFDKRTASLSMACKVLGVDLGASYDVVRSAYRKLSMQHHPDRGGDDHEFRLVNAAWSYWNSVKGKRG